MSACKKKKKQGKQETLLGLHPPITPQKFFIE